MIRTTLGLVCAGLLTACSGGTDIAFSQAGQIQTLYQNLRATQRKAEPLPTLTPQLVAGLQVATLEMILEDRDVTVFLVPYSDRTDGRPGALRTWRTADNAHFVLRSGVLVATRGLGTNIGSADVSGTVAAIRSGSAQTANKSLFLRTGDNGTDRMDFSCTITPQGAQQIDIVGKIHDTHKLSESCVGAENTFTNEYWVADSNGAVLLSRQWAGPTVGYIRTRLLKQ